MNLKSNQISQRSVITIINTITIHTARHRFQKAKEDYDTAVNNIEYGHYEAASDRAFFCFYHAARALLVYDGVDISKPTEIISNFKDLYIKQRYHDPRLCEMFETARKSRNDGIYEDCHEASLREAQTNTDNALYFLKAAESIANRRLALEHTAPSSFDADEPEP